MKQGPYKGHIGVVKDATDSTARIELHSSCQTISVDRSRLSTMYMQREIHLARSYCHNLCSISGTKEVLVVGNPLLMVGRPCMVRRLQCMVPVAPEHLCMDHKPLSMMVNTAGSLTLITITCLMCFVNDLGSRTPHYGSQTPQHDGSRTPRGAGSAWDPTNANTPARTDYDYDYESSPAPFGGATPNPQTPGYAADSPSPQTPYANPPQTPGSYATDRTYSPYGVPSPSPQGAYGEYLLLTIYVH